MDTPSARSGYFWLCPRCKTRNKAREPFCHACGAALSDVPINTVERVEASGPDEANESLLPASLTMRTLIAIGIVGAIGAGFMVRQIFTGADLRSEARDMEERRTVMAPPRLTAGPQEPPTGAVPSTGPMASTPTARTTSDFPPEYPRTTRRGWTVVQATGEPDAVYRPESDAIIRERSEEVRDARQHFEEVQSVIAASGGLSGPGAERLLPEMEAAAARLRRAESALDRMQRRTRRASWRP